MGLFDLNGSGGPVFFVYKMAENISKFCYNSRELNLKKGDNMKKILLIATVLGLLVSCAEAFDQNVAIEDALARVANSAAKVKNAKVISIVPFEYGPGFTVKNVEDKIVLKLAKTGSFKVMDKRSLEALISEKKFSLTGLTDQATLKDIGALLNADTLLFGKVVLSGESVVITINMKDVVSGAVVWADEFVGVDLNKVTFGPGIRSGFFNGSVRYVLNDNATNFSSVNGGSADNQFFFAFTGSFEQSLQSMKAISFSLDGIFYRGFFQPDPVDSLTTIGADIYEFKSTCNYTNLKLQLCALVRLHLGYMFDWNNDIVVVYFGPGLDANYMLADATYRLTQTTGGTFDSGDITYKKQIGEVLAFGGMTFRVGVELKLSTNFSVFMEAFYIPEITVNMINVDAQSRILPKVTISQGNSTYGLGIKYVIF